MLGHFRSFLVNFRGFWLDLRSFLPIPWHIWWVSVVAGCFVVLRLFHECRKCWEMALVVMFTVVSGIFVFCVFISCIVLNLCLLSGILFICRFVYCISVSRINVYICICASL